ncbi:afadin- and alpha-actinin-binding protein A-like [Temnothorax curvispinosus]|uniref:Afadin- and alpha-actinin-binding protein A-like n=1 Tax=Temnothorax curvispinosus TaxID=300111 RepID=A0A6J1PTA6_9HYME|nr:afadin- and alpha-actinin-binding protein A-like [Temnothorax curvispinosus]XP_024873092.1 afadin- and alpha-actinin-binding protein A-like [Temnothorax curvispinosus]
MSAISNGTYPKRDLRSMLAERNDFISEETVFCKQDNLEQSLHILNEEFESLIGIPPVAIGNDRQSAESLKKLCVQVINATWKLTHKHRYLMRLHDQLIDLNQRTVNDNVTLKNHIKRLKEDLEKKEHTICKVEERERRLNVKFEDASRDLKQEKEEIRKLKKQAQFKETQHEHEIRRITQNSQKLQEQLHKSAGSFTPRDKLLEKMHEKELTGYKKTICRLEENNRQMLQEINNLKEALELHKIGIDLHIEASGGTWANVDT